MSKIKKEKRFARDSDDRGDLAWIISTSGSEPIIIDIFRYEARDYIAAKSKDGYVKTFDTVGQARKWAKKHPDRL